ncbi:hypothetical protein CPE01_23990 [Cellulomonas persica]|uniref:Uncharacterized protein n=1 Tax=Cellulomonas persica TaxID=76861 RepID=A0A510UVY3_9CELL|nr:hypothetical protein CPE01_23990 [Cellulomonas persica]
MTETPAARATSAILTTEILLPAKPCRSACGRRVAGPGHGAGARSIYRYNARPQDPDGKLPVETFNRRCATAGPSRAAAARADPQRRGHGTDVPVRPLRRVHSKVVVTISRLARA